MESNQRLGMLNAHFTPEIAANFNARKVGPKNPDDVVVVSCARTAMTRAKKGAQKDSAPEVMLTPVLKDVIKKAGCDPKTI